MRPLTLLILAAALCLTGCRESTPRPDAPRPRIVSYSPALTDMLFDVGLGDHVVGVTRWCVLPAGEDRPVVGDLARVSTEAILNVKPDVVLIQQNPRDFGALRSVQPDVRIEHFAIETLDDISAAIERLGRIAGREELGKARRAAFDQELAAIRERVAGRPRPGALFVLGYDRQSTAGAGTFLDEMIALAGGRNLAAAKYDRWANISNEGVLALAPDVLVCQVEPGQAQAARDHWRKLKDLPAVRAGRVHVVTDRRWTIPSTRSAAFAAELAAMIHPAAGGGDPP